MAMPKRFHEEVCLRFGVVVVSHGVGQCALTDPGYPPGGVAHGWHTHAGPLDVALRWEQFFQIWCGGAGSAVGLPGRLRGGQLELRISR
jgi:hypothetical protein